jgi:hydrogenase expression/formation protein HypC
MCLGIPGQIVTIQDNIAVVDFWGTLKNVRIDALDEPAFPGAFIISHAGAAVRIIPPHEVIDTIALYETVLAEAGALCEDAADLTPLVTVG